MGFIKDRWKAEPARRGKNRDTRYQVWVTVDGREKYAGAYRTQAIARRHLVEHESRAQRGAWVDLSDETTVGGESGAGPRPVRTARRPRSGLSARSPGRSRGPRSARYGWSRCATQTSSRG